jgi:hypothetical protein
MAVKSFTTLATGVEVKKHFSLAMGQSTRIHLSAKPLLSWHRGKAYPNGAPYSVPLRHYLQLSFQVMEHGTCNHFKL